MCFLVAFFTKSPTIIQIPKFGTFPGLINGIDTLPAKAGGFSGLVVQGSEGLAQPLKYLGTH